MACNLGLYELVKIHIKTRCNGYYLRWYYNGWHYWFFYPGSQFMITEGEKYRTTGTKKIAMGSGQVTYEQALAIKSILNTREVYLLTIYGWMNIRVESGTIVINDSKLQAAEFEITAIIGSKELSIDNGFSPVTLPEVIAPDITYCELVIDLQIWMCKNFDSNFPGSKVYDDLESNRVIYGGLYTFNQIMSPGFCPAGWHIPTQAEWQDLIDYVGSLATAGGELKEVGTTHWNAPNTDAVDTYGFAALGAGFGSVDPISGILGYSGLKNNSYFWTATANGVLTAYTALMAYDSGAVQFIDVNKNTYLPVRLLKNIPAPPPNHWFLASEDELMEIRTELYNHAVGGFSLLSHWCSTEFDVNNARNITFFTGLASQTAKNNTDPNVYYDYCRSFISATVYNLRDPGELGGWIFHIINNGDGTFTYYEAKPGGNGIAWSNITASLVGTGSAIGTGKTNTAAIIAQPGHVTSVAKLCDDLIPF